jgi:WD40 repeat protein
LSPNGSTLVTIDLARADRNGVPRLTSARAARVWDFKTGAELFSLRGHTGAVMAVAFSPDGTRIATAGDDGTVRLWDARSGAEVLSLHVPSAIPWVVTFSPDGSRLATTGMGIEARVWDAKAAK